MWQPSNVSARHESRGETAASSAGTTLTSHASANTKASSWTTVGAVTGFAYEAITVCLGANDSLQDYMVDIGIGATNQYVLVADLHFAAVKVLEHGVQIYIPVHVGAGQQLAARCASSAGGAICEITVIGHASGLGGAPGFSRCVALFTPGSSRGIAVDPGGTANTKGAWSEMTSSCPEDIGAMFGLVGYNADTARAASATALIDVGIGAAASEFVLYPNAYIQWGAVKDGPSNCPRIPVFACDVPKTTRIAARGACSLNTAGDRTFDLSIYGLVK